MWSYPDIDPVLLSLGPFKIHWYAISYLVGISLAWWLAGYRARKYNLPWTEEQISDVAFYAVLGVILGGRIGYMLFYNISFVLNDPLQIFRVWEGGMSFHGGMLGVLIGMYLYGRMNGRTFFQVTDFMVVGVPIGLGCGRLGNFANTELPGRITDVPWAVIFPGETFGRHPSSLYQFFLEGPVLFAVLYFFARKPRPEMAVSGVFLIGYGALRIFTELFRQPDQGIDFIAFGWLTMGQALSLPMILFGAAFLIYSYLRKQQGES